MTRLSGKVAVVTGAGRSGGLGAAIAQRLAQDGAHVIVSDIGRAVDDATPVEMIGAHNAMADVVDAIRVAGGSGSTFACDVSSWKEVQALVGVLGEERSGVFQLASEPAVASHDPDVRKEYAERMKALALDTGVPIAFGLFGTERGREQLDLIDDTIAHGGRMFGLTHCRGIGSVMSFLTRLPFDKLPAWSELRARPHNEQLAAIQNPDVRTRLVLEAQHGAYGRAIGAEARRPDYERMEVMRSAYLPNQSVAAEARARGVEPVELIIDLAIETNLKQLFVQPLVWQDDAIMVPMLRHPATAMTFSDSGAHVSQIVDCSIQTFLLSSLVRERQVFTLEEAVNMITLRPAAHWHLGDRGLLREGMAADINIFDADKIGPELPVVADDLPGGSRRYVQKATGFDATIVNGSVLLRNGEETGERPGRLLRNRSAA